MTPITVAKFHYCTCIHDRPFTLTHYMYLYLHIHVYAHAHVHVCRLNIITLHVQCHVSSLIRYDSHKGFFCVVKEGRKRCLGKGKGRSYPPMSTADHQWLESYYSPHNARLRELLTELGRTHPGWLLEGQPH